MYSFRKITVFVLTLALVLTMLPASIFAAAPPDDQLVNYIVACKHKGTGEPRYGQGNTDETLGDQMIYFFNGNAIESENDGIPTDTALMDNQYGYDFKIKTVSPAGVDKWENYIEKKLHSNKAIEFGITYSGEQTDKPDNFTTVAGSKFMTNFLPKVNIKNANDDLVLTGGAILKDVIYQGIPFNTKPQAKAHPGSGRGCDILFEIPAGALEGDTDYKLVIEHGIVLDPLDTDPKFNTSLYIYQDIEFNFTTAVVKEKTEKQKKKKTDKKYKVTLYANKGKFSDKKSTHVKKVAKNKALGKIAIPKRKGFQFTGWYTKKKGGTNYTSKSLIKKDLKLYANWARVASVKTNGAHLRLRDKPSLTAKIITEYPQGTKVLILKSGKSWYQVKVGKKTGYMYKEFIKLDKK